MRLVQGLLLALWPYFCTRSDSKCDLSTRHICDWLIFSVGVCWLCFVAPLFWVLNAANRALWNDVISLSISEQLASSSLSYDTVHTLGARGDYWRQTLAAFRPSCNYFTSLCQSHWVKTGCCEKSSQPDREGVRVREGSVCVCVCRGELGVWGGGWVDMLWYQMKGLLQPGNWIQGAMLEQLGGQLNCVFPAGVRRQSLNHVLSDW